MWYERQCTIHAPHNRQQLRRTRTHHHRHEEAEDKPEKLQLVDLSGMSLESLPSPSLNLALICRLNLSNNHLEEIPESLVTRLLNVVVLDVHSNQLRSLPNSIGCLSKLKLLNVSSNLIDSLPRTIENCRSLEELDANFNKLSVLPDTIGFDLINLKKLSINTNKLLFLPPSTSHLTALRVLDARLNCLRSLPYSIGLLPNLVELDVSYNKIKSLPDSVRCLKKLMKLSVEGNPMVSPPKEVVEQGVHAVKEYLCERIISAHRNQAKEKKKRFSWVGKLVKYGTFGARGKAREESDGFFMHEQYRAIAGLATPRHVHASMFSPKRLFSPHRKSSS